MALQKRNFNNEELPLKIISVRSKTGSLDDVKHFGSYMLELRIANGDGVYSKVINFIPFTYLTSIAYTSMRNIQYRFFVTNNDEEDGNEQVVYFL